MIQEIYYRVKHKCALQRKRVLLKNLVCLEKQTAIFPKSHGQSRFHTVKEVLVVGTIITQRVIIGGLIQRILTVPSFEEMVRRIPNFFWTIA